MPYYHIYMAFTSKIGTPKEVFLYNFRKEQVIKSFAVPYMENRAVMASGEFVKQDKIGIINIFESRKPFEELILPNGKSPTDEENTEYTCKCFGEHKVKGNVKLCTHEFLVSPPEEKIDLALMESASFLRLDNNWSIATCALQLQEVAVTLVAKKKKIKLDKANVEKLLNKEIKSLSFNYQYEAFSKLVKVRFNIGMPILTTLLRKMRTKVLHEGYNPKPEETESIVRFTIGLLQKLNTISQTT